jgi:hypothetical protein
MQQDTRRLTVAHDHLCSAYDEITRALGLSEASMAQQATQRALSHLDLAVKRLNEEVLRDSRRAEGAAERALGTARIAWQALHDALNDWQVAAPKALDQSRQAVLLAMDATGETEQVRLEAEAGHP